MNIPNLNAIAYFLTIVLVFTSCNKKSQVNIQLDIAESIMETMPDSALHIISRIDTNQLVGKDETARYALLKTIAIDKNYIDTTEMKLLQPAIDYYLTNGTPDEKLKTYYYQGRIHQNRNSNDLAMYSFMNGKNIYGITDSLTFARCLVSQGVIYYSLFQMENFLENNLKAAKIYHNYGRSKQELRCLAKVLDASTMLCDKERADSTYHACISITDIHHEYGHSIIANILSYKISFCSNSEISDLLSNLESSELDNEARLDMANGFCKIGNSQKAWKYLNSLENDTTLTRTLKYSLIKAKALELTGEFEQALTTYKNYIKDLEQYENELFNQGVMFAEERHTIDMAHLEEKAHKDRLILTSGGIAFFLLLLIALIYYRYRLMCAKRKIMEQEQFRLEIEKAQLEEERDNLVSLLKKDKQIEKPVQDALKQRIDMLNCILAKEITFNATYAKPFGDWIASIHADKGKFMDSTRLAFKASYPKLIEYLETHNLNEFEINYACLYAIGLRGKEVGEYIQLKRHYAISSTIRKKLGIDEHETNLGIYIRKLMQEL